MGPKYNVFVANKSSSLLPGLTSFVAVVSAGSFTRAAKASGTDKAVLSRRVARLEAALELRLLNRTTRSVRPTDDGRALFDRVVEPLTLILAELEKSAAPTRVQGKVRVSTFAGLAAVWGVIAAELKTQHPQLLLSLSASDEGGGLVDEGFDLRMTPGELSDSSMIGQKLGSWRHVLVASPEWVKSHPRVREPADLVSDWILWGGLPFANRWVFERGARSVTVHMGSAVVCTSVALMGAALHEGLGVTAAPPFFVQRDIESGRLVRVLPEWRTAHVHPLWAVRPHRDLVPARVQAVIDMAEKVVLAASPAWEMLTD
ncbi:MAG: DNA-binding transcriptional LysR family regulator [Myxococcota bacterium]|jgi:DNA-binding transcriptional LysR family regulator